MLAITLRGDTELRALEPHHAAEFLAHIDRAREHIAPWVGAGFVVSDLDGARALLQRYADGQAADQRRLYGIRVDGTLVGGTMFVSFDTGAGVCEIGCWLEQSAEGRGLITQVVRMMIDWACQVRGLTRVEWRTKPGNTRSVNVAERLGMTQESAEVWAIDRRKTELDQLTHAFFGAFANTEGEPDLDVIRGLFIPQGTIINNVGDEPVVQDLDAFIAPRQKILTDGTLTEFSEWETAERTEVVGSVAHRFSRYRKSGRRDGAWFEGAGHKTIQFVRTPAGWRISSMAWDDEPVTNREARPPSRT
ncbi:GNAT family N-acetyltransferase [Actinokineospora sp. HUAS TT18]|uniref:GNAT family N-acetyltransferase n=1 Tax=Actinokineospora sp. HUAS TT18 TaxID=3447451 RepID=UPI003F525EFB